MIQNEDSEIEELKTIKINYNYNFHDGDWNNVANSGGNARYIVDEDDDGNEVLILDEVDNSFMQRISEVDQSLGTYDPEDTLGPLIGTMLLVAMRQIPAVCFRGCEPYRDGTMTVNFSVKPIYEQ